MNWKELRIKKGITQSELSKAVGINAMTYSLIENEKCLPTKETYQKLVLTLGHPEANIHTPKGLQSLKGQNTTLQTHYNIHGRLPLEAKDLKSKLENYGYKNINEWLNKKYEELK